MWHSCNSTNTRRRSGVIVMLSKSVNFKIGNSYLNLGYNLKGIGIGIMANQYAIDLYLLFFWISLEY